MGTGSSFSEIQDRLALRRYLFKKRVDSRLLLTTCKIATTVEQEIQLLRERNADRPPPQ